MMCEDYPCCGHEAGDCPDAQGRFTCVLCGVRMARGVTSSICNQCRTRRSTSCHGPECDGCSHCLRHDN